MPRRFFGFTTLSYAGAIMLAMACGDFAFAACRFAQQGEGRVTSIIDARTFRLDDGREVRLAGLEVAAKDARALANVIDGREVTLHGENDRPDRYGRQSAFVFVKDSDFSLQTGMLSRGEAIHAATVTDTDCAREWLAAENDARTAKRGLWADAAATKNAESPGDILASKGQFTVVEGTILSARQAGATFYLNFGRRWTRDFAVTIPRRIMPAFEAAGIDFKALDSKRVRIRGWVEKHGGPRIEATRVGQLELIGADAGFTKHIAPKDEGK